MKANILYKSFLSVILSVAMISALVLSPVLNAGAEESTAHDQLPDGKVYAYKTSDEWIAEAIGKNVSVVTGKKYKFSILWKAETKDHTQVSVDGTNILAGYYKVANGASFNPYTGRLEYIFTASKDSIRIAFDNQGDGTINSMKQKSYTIADPLIYEVDDNGNKVENGYTADCDVDFCNWGYSKRWAAFVYNGLTTVEMNASDFVLAEKQEYEYDKPEDGDIHIFTFKFNSNDWDAYRYENTNITVFAGKRYTFDMLWMDLGQCKSIIKVNGTEILNGGYNTINGAIFNPATGRLSYTFVASNPTIEISIINSEQNTKHYKDYSFADPRMYEVDADGIAVENGDIVDCDGDFDNNGWKLIALPSGNEKSIDAMSGIISLTGGNSADFVLRSNHSETASDGKVYAFQDLKSWDQKRLEYSPFVFNGKTYTFSMYYKVTGSTTTRISVNGIKILDGDYNVISPAKYDPYTGLITYTFTATSNKAAIVLDNLGSTNNEKYHSYTIAVPRLIETDENGTVTENGDVADCDSDFCQWSFWNYSNNSIKYYDVLEKRIEISLPSMAERETPHTQPSEDVMHVLYYNRNWNCWTNSSLRRDVFVLKGKTYTFRILMKDYTKTTRLYVDDILILKEEFETQNGASNDVQTGLLTYTFKASKNTVSLVFDNAEDSRKRHYYEIANPVMYESDASGNAVAGGDVADCDVDFCSDKWYTISGLNGNKINNEFAVEENSDFGFAATVKFGDVNGDGAFNIVDLIVTKKQLANVYNGNFNYMSLGKSGTDKTLNSNDLVFVRSLLLGTANGRSKVQLKSLIGKLHNEVGADNSNRYAIGINLAGSTKVAKNVETFESKFNAKPAYVDYDMCSLPFITASNNEYLIAQLARFNKEGGFIALTSHWLVPTKKISESSNGGANNSRYALTAEQYIQVYTKGNSLYDNFREELAIEAKFIQSLKNYGINVIYRPLHECNYGSFWWCANTANNITTEMVAELYNYVYNYFTNECGLDNIIWQLNVDAKHDTSTIVSPLNIDMLSLDCYLNGTNESGIATDYNNLYNKCGNKTYAISEFFADKPEDYNYNPTSMLETLMNELTYKFAYLGIYCNLSELAETTLPDNVLTLSDTAAW